MSSTAFEAALSQPDDDASNSQLCTLISARDYSGPTLPAVAESYLRAFCEITPSAIRRRWVGIALAGMMGQSPAVVAHIRQMGRELQKLGAIIQSNGEQEETKIIAGIIMRQGLEQGIEYGNFWDSDKVKHSAPNFPDKHDARWMQQFQKFLDTLGELAITNPTTDALILFPISLVTSDDFRWRDSSNGLPVALLQSGHIIIIAPNERLEGIQFVDIPVSHVRSIRSEPARLHDSQAQKTKYEPWDVILTLSTVSWSYRLNSVQRTATDFSFLFVHEGDAKEWKSCIEKELKELKEPKVHPTMSRSSPIATGSSSDRDLNTRKPPPRASQSQRVGQSIVQTLLVESSDPIVQRPRSQPSEQAPPEQTSPKMLSSSKQATYSKGKLPRISQATKQKALKQLRAQSDDLDMPTDGEAELADLPGASSSATSSSERSQPPRQTRGHARAKVTKMRKSQTKHEADDDEEFVPDGLKAKKTTGKRKSAPNIIADSKPAKKARGRPVNNAKATASRPKQQNKPKASAQPPSSVASSYHSLLGGLLGSTMPTKTSSAPFKIPKILTKTAQTPSTPTKPRRKPVEAPTRLQTPTDARRHPKDDALRPIASSPPSPTHYVPEDRSVDRLRQSAVETEILSSNSKPVPASPNAESTAISGHANRDDVASEKLTGDFQMAKSDPFTQRTKVPVVTGLYRRLTKEGAANANIELTIGLSHNVPVTGNEEETSRAEPVVVASQSIPQSMPWQKKANPSEIIAASTNSVSGAANTRRSAVGVKVRSPQITDSPTEVRQRKQDANMRDAQKSKRKATPTSQQSSHETSANVDCNPTRQASTEMAQTQTIRLQEETTMLQEETTRLQEETEGLQEQTGRMLGQTARPSQRRASRSPKGECVDMGDSILDAPKRFIDNTQAEYTDQSVDMEMEGDTLPGEYGDDEQPEMGPKASPLTFRSSPPVPGSPSSHSSTSAEPEPPTDPPELSSQAEEMEWEASLQPHQRALHDLLLRTSKRVMRHIVDNETGVTGIAETFAKDGEHVLDSLLQRHDSDYNNVFQDMKGKKKILQRELERAAKQMADERRRINAMV
jgi:hypothetical protein